MSDWLEKAKEQALASEGDGGDSSYAEVWKPEPGDMLAGVVVRGDYVSTANGDRHLLVIKDEETGTEYTVWCSSYMLKQAVIDKAPAEGSLIVIHFHGKQQSKKDPTRSFNNYTVKVEKTDFEYWNNVMKRFFARQQAKPSPSHQGSGLAPDPLTAPF